jgi:hypothetical protein
LDSDSNRKDNLTLRQLTVRAAARAFRETPTIRLTRKIDSSRYFNRSAASFP